MKIILKIFVWLLGIILALLIAVLIFISPITKYMIEKNSVEWTGRQIRMVQLSINLFNGKVNISGFKLFEPDPNTVFVGFEHLLVDVDLRKLFDQQYRIEQLKVTGPRIRVIQNGDRFNFSDLIDRFASDTAAAETDTAPVQYYLERIEILGGKLDYTNSDFSVDAQLRQIDLNCPAFAWNTTLLDLGYRFSLNSGGLFAGKLNLNLNDLVYIHDFRIDNFNLAVMYPYLTPYMKIKAFEGLFSADLKTRGNFNDPEAVAVKGTAGIYKANLTDENGKRVAGFNLFNIAIDSLNLRSNIWNFGNILVDAPYFRYEMFPATDNFTRLMVPAGNGMTAAEVAETDTAGSPSQFNPFILMAEYVKTLAEQLIITDYRIKRFSVVGGVVDFRDHTLHEEFSLNLHDFYFDVQQINPDKGRATADFSTSVNRNGFIMAQIAINPLDFLDFRVAYEMKNVAVIDYNPYSIFHVATPFSKGKLNYKGVVEVKDHKIKMDNDLFVEKIYAGKKVKNQTAMDIPVRLALAIMRDKHGNITLVVPVEGDLDDPKFNYWKIIGQVLKNLIVKAVAAPGKLFTSVFGGSEEDFKEIKFDYTQTLLTEKQMSQLKKLGTVITEKPELIIDFRQVADTAKELEYLAYFEASKRYYFETVRHQPVPDSLTAEEFAAVAAINRSGAEFRDWLDAKVKLDNPEMVSTLDKCILFIGLPNLQTIQSARMERRNRGLERYLVTEAGLPTGRFRINNNTDPAAMAEDRQSRYIITYGIED
jgi:hypothetical protein